MITLSKTESQLFEDLRLALLPLFDVEIVRGLDNQVPPPIGDYIVITPIVNTRQGTNQYLYTDTTQAQAVLYTYTIQIDCYGLQSGNMSSIINLLFRGDYFNDKGISPLTCSNPRQLVFEGVEHQMIERWQQDIDVSYNPSINIPQQTANTLNLEFLNPADVFTN